MLIYGCFPSGGDSLSQEASTKPTMNVAPSGDTNSEAMCAKTETKCKTETDVKTEEGVEEGEARTEGVKVENGAVKEEVKVEECMSVTVKSESSERSSEGAGDKDAEAATTTSEVETDGFVKDEIILLPEDTVVKPDTPPAPADTSKAEEAIKTDSDSSDDELEHYGMPPTDMSFAREKLDTPQDVSSSTLVQVVSCCKSTAVYLLSLVVVFSSRHPCQPVSLCPFLSMDYWYLITGDMFKQCNYSCLESSIYTVAKAVFIGHKLI